MKTIKIISGGLNNGYHEIAPTSIGISGKVRSLKRDGTFIEGRYPLPEEETELWRFSLTSKERVNKNDTRLYARIYVPEEDVDTIDDSNKNKLGLYKHLIEHKDACYFKTLVENGQSVKKQVNKNFVRNHLLYFEIIDETAAEEKKYQDARIETKYRAIIDKAYDENKIGGEFMEMCYGCGILRPERNIPIQNYNLLVNKLQINAENFALYYEDEDRSMVNVIQKGMKIGAEENVPYITQKGNEPYYFNSTAIGKNMDEMKLHFKQHVKEYEWLKKVTSSERIAVPPELVPDVKAMVEQVKEEITPRPKDTTLKNSYEGMDNKTHSKMAKINTELGLCVGLAAAAKKRPNEKGLDTALSRIEKLREKYPDELNYINNELSKKALQKGISLT